MRNKPKFVTWKCCMEVQLNSWEGRNTSKIVTKLQIKAGCRMPMPKHHYVNNCTEMVCSSYRNLLILLLSQKWRIFIINLSIHFYLFGSMLQRTPPTAPLLQRHLNSLEGHRTTSLNSYISSDGITWHPWLRLHCHKCAVQICLC